MSSIPLPLNLTRAISQRAAQIAREYGLSKGWKSTKAIKPYFADGIAGISLADAPYLHFVDKGTKPRLMTNLEGKTIRMPDGHGGVQFRKVKGVGQPGYVTLPGGARVWRNQKWFNPGIKAQNFMANSLQQAIDENQKKIAGLVNDVARGSYRG